MKKIHYEEKPKLNNLYILMLFFLFIYGIYKNGLIVSNNMALIHSIILILIGPLSGLILDLIFEKKVGKFTLYGFLLSISMPYNTNILWFSLFLIPYYLLLNSKLKINPVIMFHVLFVFLFSLSYENILEANVPLFYGMLDTFFGRSIGGIGTTCLWILIISFIFFSTRFYYKKEIPLLSLGSFCICSIIYDLITKNNALFLHLLNPTVFYLTVFLLPLNEYSPILKKNQYIYAILTGIMMYIFSFYKPILGLYIGAFIISLGLGIGKLLSKKRN